SQPAAVGAGLPIRFCAFGLGSATAHRKDLQPRADRAEVSAYSSICRQGHPPPPVEWGIEMTPLEPDPADTGEGSAAPAPSAPALRFPPDPWSDSDGHPHHPFSPRPHAKPAAVPRRRELRGRVSPLDQGP